ncbi:MAG TPA: HDIG domain-containing protein [Deltaproteobacteria bacterium]|nr:HDIG domain-containing protein [Deltaproteobacteria bacterium]
MEHPTRSQALDLLHEYQVPHHIIEHSMVVRRVATAIACSMVLRGVSLDITLVDRAAMLHDICKMHTVTSGGDHALLGQELLSSMGYSLLGDVVGQHVHLRSFDLSEAMVVNYADKRVMHEKIVSVTRRFIDLMIRYGTDDARRARIMAQHHKTLKIQDIIAAASALDLSSLEMLHLIPSDKAFNG